MAISASDFRYNPVNLGNVAQPFAAGFEGGRNTQLSQAIAQMFSHGIAETGAMNREKVSQAGQNKRSLIAAGYPEEAGLPGKSMQSIQGIIESLPENSDITWSDKGIKYTRKGSKIDPIETDKKQAVAIVLQNHKWAPPSGPEEEQQYMDEVERYFNFLQKMRTRASGATVESAAPNTVPAAVTPSGAAKFNPAAALGPARPFGGIIGDVSVKGTPPSGKSRVVNVPGMGNLTVFGD